MPQKKKVYAFYIVDAECGYTTALTKATFAQQLEMETIKIPAAEKAQIMEAFCGYTTWQDIQKVIPNVNFKKKEEIGKQTKENRLWTA